MIIEEEVRKPKNNPKQLFFITHSHQHHHWHIWCHQQHIFRLPLFQSNLFRSQAELRPKCVWNNSDFLFVRSQSPPGRERDGIASTVVIMGEESSIFRRMEAEAQVWGRDERFGCVNWSTCLSYFLLWVYMIIAGFGIENIIFVSKRWEWSGKNLQKKSWLG